jgi:hypothetical protein
MSPKVVDGVKMVVLISLLLVCTLNGLPKVFGAFFPTTSVHMLQLYAGYSFCDKSCSSSTTLAQCKSDIDTASHEADNAACKKFKAKFQTCFDEHHSNVCRSVV